MGQKSDSAYSASITLTFVLFLALLQTTPLNTGDELYLTHEMYIVFEGTLLSNGQPNSVAERIVNGKNLYGFPSYVEVTTAYPYGEINNALVDYFHSAGINVSARVWSDGGDNPIGTIESQIDQILAWASHVDMIMIDECNGDMYSYLQTLANFVHNKGKLICFNMAGWSFSENHIPMADLISIEYAWREFVIEHSDWINSYPDKFFGVSYDFGYDYLGQPDITVDLDRAIYDTKEAWNSGIHYYYAIGGTEGGGAFVLPTWYEDYLQALAQVRTPTFNPGSGVYGVAQNVTISSATSGATLYYTDDGSTPTAASTEYTAPVEVATSKTLKALGVKASYTNSAVGVASYTINNPVTPSAAAVRAYLAMLRRR